MRVTALPLKGFGGLVGCFHVITPSRLRASAGCGGYRGSSLMQAELPVEPKTHRHLIQVYGTDVLLPVLQEPLD
jgi:hypothetical protein